MKWNMMQPIPSYNNQSSHFSFLPSWTVCNEMKNIQTIEHKYLPLYSILDHKSKHRQKIKMKVDIFKSI
jgi:hypothetical protein